jgi:hypothetical protein
MTVISANSSCDSRVLELLILTLGSCSSLFLNLIARSSARHSIFEQQKAMIISFILLQLILSISQSSDRSSTARRLGGTGAIPGSRSVDHQTIHRLSGTEAIPDLI